MENKGKAADARDPFKEKVTGSLQKIIGEIEEIGGALTGDPTTQAEGQFNVEVGEIREELAEGEVEPDSDDARI